MENDDGQTSSNLSFGMIVHVTLVCAWKYNSHLTHDEAQSDRTAEDGWSLFFSFWETATDLGRDFCRCSFQRKGVGS